MEILTTQFCEVSMYLSIRKVVIQFMIGQLQRTALYLSLTIDIPPHPPLCNMIVCN